MPFINIAIMFQPFDTLPVFIWRHIHSYLGHRDSKHLVKAFPQLKRLYTDNGWKAQFRQAMIMDCVVVVTQDEIISDFWMYAYHNRKHLSMFNHTNIANLIGCAYEKYATWPCYIKLFLKGGVFGCTTCGMTCPNCCIELIGNSNPKYPTCIKSNLASDTFAITQLKQFKMSNIQWLDVPLRIEANLQDQETITTSISITNCKFMSSDGYDMWLRICNFANTSVTDCTLVMMGMEIESTLGTTTKQHYNLANLIFETKELDSLEYIIKASRSTFYLSMCLYYIETVSDSLHYTAMIQSNACQSDPATLGLIDIRLGMHLKAILYDNRNVTAQVRDIRYVLQEQ
ncbi:Hypothetical protein MVR_LOCUS85 [uncultured virus]|nr:Hypothetical protein MVR_LOCUS85 [uncultured virus]